MFPLRLGRPLGVAGITLVAALTVAAASVGADWVPEAVPDVAVKAAFLYNFAKFTEWPSLPSGAPIAACIVGDDAVAAALTDIVRGQQINGHSIDVSRSQGGGTWRICQVLFIAGGETHRATDGLSGIKTLPVLSVSDGKGFAQSDGIIELYVDDGRMRFAINVKAAERSGLRLSSRLLGLSKVVRSSDVQ
jgi:hypothetical protein